jgi:5-methylcytosine-specific restriction endonuclease McrA
MRKSIPKTLKNDVWDKYISRKKGIGQCYCCKKTIDSKNFECGHVLAVAKGGKTILQNLRPICGVCNKSMGTENLQQFKKKYYTKPNVIDEKIAKIEFLKKICRNI